MLEERVKVYIRSGNEIVFLCHILLFLSEIIAAASLPPPRGRYPASLPAV
jgi:hypothetical protein